MTPKNQKYREILTLDSLEAELRQVHGSNKAWEEDLRDRFASMQDVYTPQSLMQEGVRRTLHSVSFYGIALSAITTAKRLLRKKKK